MGHGAGSGFGPAPSWLALALVLLAGCRTTTPERSASASCAPGEVRVCLGRCVAPRALGEACTVDECAADANVCRAELACVPAGPAGSARCEAANPFCNPDLPAGAPGNRCPGNAFCRRLGSEDELERGEACALQIHLGRRVPRGLCANPLREGEPCDSDWIDARNANGAAAGAAAGETFQSPILCRPCAPGLRCFGNVCRRPCDVEIAGRLAPRGVALPTVGACPADPAPAGAVAYRCEQNYALRMPRPGDLKFEDAWLCTTCGTVGNRCPAAGGESQPVTRRSTLTIAGEMHHLTAGPDGSRLCCNQNAVCVDGLCCIAPGRSCTSNRECCGLHGLGSICCGDPSNGDPLVRFACNGQGSNCIGCGGNTGLPCPTGASCVRSTDCAAGSNCRDGHCEYCGSVGQPCCDPRSGPGQPPCNQEGFCGPDGRCTACGAIGAPCCPAPARRCAIYNRCVRDERCERCGLSMLVCCEGDTPCFDHLQCTSGQCVTPNCGNLGQRCCDDGTCPFAREAICDALPGGAPQCLACGGSEQRCCAGRSCTSGLTCLDVPGVGPRCRACGGAPPQPCCPGGFCAGRNVCVNEQCVPCGSENRPCCTTGASCGPSLECDQRRLCICGVVDRPCCATGGPCDREPDVTRTCGMDNRCH